MQDQEQHLRQMAQMGNSPLVGGSSYQQRSQSVSYANLFGAQPMPVPQRNSQPNQTNQVSQTLMAPQSQSIQNLHQKSISQSSERGQAMISSKRIDIINHRRKDRIKNELLTIFGPQSEAAVDQAIVQHIDGFLAQEMKQEDIIARLTNIIRQMGFDNQKSINQNTTPQLYSQPQTLQPQIPPSSSAFQLNMIQQHSQGHRNLSGIGNSIVSQESNRQHYSFNQPIKTSLQPPDPNSISPIKRPLPIKPKEQVYNEWAAVVKHQDEIDQRINQEEQAKLKLRKIRYKQELDSQLNQLQQVKSSEKVLKYSAEHQMLDYLKRQQDEKEWLEEQKRNKLKEQVQQNINMSLSEKQKAENDQRDRLRDEQSKFRNQILMQQENQRQKELQEKQHKQQFQNQYLQELSQQERQRKTQSLQARQEDKVYAKLHESKLEQHEESRQQFMAGIKRYQELNDIKHQQLSQYLVSDLATQAKKDEEAYLKAVQEREERERRREEEQQRNQARSKSMNMNNLNYQVQEKQTQQRVNQIQEQSFGNQIRNQVNQHQQDEAAKQEAAKQKEYLQELSKQLEEQAIKKKYGVLMTEHERRVNDKDIKAFENQEMKIHSYLPGQKSSETTVQEKYLNKLFNNGAPAMNQQAQAYFNVNQGSSKRYNGNRSTLQLGAEQQLQSQSLSSIDTGVYEQVKKNMERPEALKFRNNTGNKAYGFDQTLEKQVAQKYSINPEDHHNSYNFSVAGNHKH